MIGNKEILIFDVGEKVDDSPDLCYLDIWIAGRRTTTFDNIAFKAGIISAAKHDLEKERDLSKYKNYYDKMSVVDIHQFILSTRNDASSNYNLENDELFLEHQAFNWGPNTDNITSFLIEQNGDTYLTVQFYNNLEDRKDKDVVYYTEIEYGYYKAALEQLIKELTET